MSSKTPIELQIQSLLKSQISHDLVADHLRTDLRWENLSLAELESVCWFYIAAGFQGNLVQILISKIKTIPIFPWAHFTEALSKSGGLLQEEPKEIILKAAEMSTESLDHLSRTHAMDNYSPLLSQTRDNRRRNQKLQYFQQRSELFSQVEVMSSQGLYEEEEKILGKILRLFPNDPEAEIALVSCKKRKAMELFGRKPSANSRPPPIEKKDPEQIAILKIIEASQHEQLRLMPDLAEDFSVSQWMWDNPEAGLRFLENAPIGASQDWLRLELLIKARHFLQALEELPKVEFRYAADPETTWAAIYYRAQALWGLGEKLPALEMLESLSASRPDYRSVGVLLSEMKGDFN